MRRPLSFLSVWSTLASLVVCQALAHEHDHHHHDEDHHHQLPIGVALSYDSNLASSSRRLRHDFHDQNEKHVHHHHHHTKGVSVDTQDTHHRKLSTTTLPMETCGTPSMSADEKFYSAQVTQDWLEENVEPNTTSSRRRLESFTAVIPVYFHAIQKDSVVGVLSTADRDNMMTALQDGYAGTGFSFVHMATDAVINATFHECGAMKAVDEFSVRPIQVELHQGGTDALNIYLCNTEKNSSIGSGITTGWSSFPIRAMTKLPIDGVFLTNPSTSSRPPLSAYMALIHEVRWWPCLMCGVFVCVCASVCLFVVVWCGVLHVYSLHVHLLARSLAYINYLLPGRSLARLAAHVYRRLLSGPA